MSEVRRPFDWFAFLVRILVVTVLATLSFADRMIRHDHIGATAVAIVGYLILPAIVYAHTRYYNSAFLLWIIKAVRQRRN